MEIRLPYNNNNNACSFHHRFKKTKINGVLKHNFNKKKTKNYIIKSSLLFNSSLYFQTTYFRKFYVKLHHLCKRTALHAYGFCVYAFGMSAICS